MTVRTRFGTHETGRLSNSGQRSEAQMAGLRFPDVASVWKNQLSEW